MSGQLVVLVARLPVADIAQVNKKEDIMVIDSAHDDHFDAFYSKPAKTLPYETSKADSLLTPYFDGSASWFT